jgi:hypothetical protein
MSKIEIFATGSTMSAASPLSGMDRPVVEINNAVKLTGRISVAAFAFSSAARLHC